MTRVPKQCGDCNKIYWCDQDYIGPHGCIVQEEIKFDFKVPEPKKKRFASKKSQDDSLVRNANVSFLAQIKSESIVLLNAIMKGRL